VSFRTFNRPFPVRSSLGAKPDLFAAAGLGRLDLLASFFDGAGRLVSTPRRRGKMSARDAIGLAMLFAYVRRQPEAVDSSRRTATGT
jgi:hypothetical protein